MRFRSPKRQHECNDYNPAKDDFLERYPECRCGLSGCTGWATEVHHMLGKEGRRLLLIRYWLPICRACHTQITDDSDIAIDNGWSLFRGARDIDWEEYTLDQCVDYGFLFGLG